MGSGRGDESDPAPELAHAKHHLSAIDVVNIYASMPVRRSRDRRATLSTIFWRGFQSGFVLSAPISIFLGQTGSQTTLNVKAVNPVNGHNRRSDHPVKA